MNQKFPKEEKLKQKKQILLLLEKGKRFSCGHLRLIALKDSADFLPKMGVSVSKKFFKKATDRNRIKRLLRELYRLNKNLFAEKFGGRFTAMLFYVSSEKPTKLENLQEDFKNLFS